MTEYIEREAAITGILACEHVPGTDQNIKVIDAYDAIQTLPAAPVREVVPGHWMWDQGTRTCNQCGQMRATDKRDNFCPNCGADMKVTEEE